MTARLRAALALILVLALGSAWLYLYRHTQAVDPAAHGRVLDLIREARQLDADMNVDMLKTLAELHRNYDALARSAGRMGAIQPQLGAQARDSRSAAVEQAHAAVEEVLERKLQQVEQFKGTDSLLKNSLRYLPTAHGQVQPALRRAQAALESDLSALLAGVLKYQVLPDEGTAEALRAALPPLRLSTSGLAPPLREATDNLLLHVEAVLRERARQALLMTQVARLPVAEKLDQLGAAFTARFDLELQRQARFQQYLLWYSGFALLAVASAIAFVLYRGATEIRRMNEVVRRTTAALTQSETQLVHAEKMSMLGEVVSGIVHEINTPLGYLRSGLESSRENLDTVLQPHAVETQRLLDLLQDGRCEPALAGQAARVEALQRKMGGLGILEETGTLLDDGIEGVRQISQTVVNLLNFSRLGRSRVASCRVESGLDSTLKLASHFLRTRRVVCRYGATPEIQCDLAQLNQVFLNIIKNAAQATRAAEGEITITTSPAGGDQVRVDIADNGAGIAAADLPRVFEAFYSSRKDQGGTGLGLSISQKIVEAHGGSIAVVSQPGQGAVFSIFLPLAPPPSLYAGFQP